jgi:glutathione synthase
MKLAVLMDDIANIKPQKDTTLAMLLAAQELNLELYIFDSCDMFYQDENIYAITKKIQVFDKNNCYRILSEETNNLQEMDIVLMRKDPPFDMNYIYATYFLEKLERQGVKVVNNPRSLRDFNEKITITQFPHLIAPTLISSNFATINIFSKHFNEFVLKPLDAMGGIDIFKYKKNDDIQQSVEYLTNQQITPIMVQKFIPEIKDGDKRIILIKGNPVPYALARIPVKGSFKGNLAQGASFEVRDLTPRDKYICAEIKDFLVSNGLDFVGIDVIGDYLSEINITSPTGVREIDRIKNISIAKDFIAAII